jgi:hypothetical protein
MASAQEDRAPVNRRGVIAGVAGLVVGTLAAKAVEPVAATDGDPMLVGKTMTGSSTTTLNSTVANLPAFRVINAFGGNPDNNQDGIQGYAAQQQGQKSNSGVFGRNNDLDGVGIWGEAQSGTGAFGDSGSGSGVAGNSGTGAGVYGQSTSGYGGQFTGGAANLYLQPGGGASPPGGSHQVGEIFVAQDGTLFYCTAGGNTPAFQVAAGPSAAGSFHFLSNPDRYVDTRDGTGGVRGPLGSNVTQTYQITNRPGQGGVVIPAGATAIVGSLIALGQPNAINGSFLTIWAGGKQPPTSNINYGPGQVIANSFFSLLSSDGKVNVFNRTDANYVVDVIGYYL